MTQDVVGLAGAAPDAGAQFVGLDVAMAKTAVCVIDAAGRRQTSATFAPASTARTIP